MTVKISLFAGLVSEFVCVSSTRSGYRDLLSALGASVDRLVDPLIDAGAARERLVRLATSIFAGSFVLAGAAAIVLPAVTGPAGLLSVVSAILALSWLAALSVSKANAERFAAAGMLGVAAVTLGLLSAAAGGLSSPLALLLAGLVIEPLWVYRSRVAAWVGAGAICAAGFSAAAAPVEAMTAYGWYWIPVAAYLASVALRFVPVQVAEAAPERALSTYVGEDAIALRFGDDGEIVDAPASRPQGFGIEPELLFGTGLLDRVHISDRLHYLTALADGRLGAGSSRTELRLRLPIIADEAAVTVRFGLFELNIAADGRTAVLRQLELLDDLRDQLAASQKHSASVSAAKSRLLASVSHELRTPLNAIIGFSDMLLLDLCGPMADPRQRENITLVRDSGQHLLSVVNAILDVSRIESGVHALALEPFRFADAVELCRSMISAQAGAKSINIDVEIGREVGELNADRRAVQQILINLVSNAVKFTPAGGAVKISAQRIGSRLSFSVSDNGIGIAKEDMAGLGQPFTQVRNDYTRQYDGLGLGLSLVKGLVALHGGSMEIESAPGEGTSVEISLPVNGPAQDGSKRLVRLEDSRPRHNTKDDRHGAQRKTA